MLAYERVDVLNITNGQRFSTYVIEAPANSGQIVVNGAAARLVQKGDLLIICAFVIMADMAAGVYQPKIVRLGYDNRIVSGDSAAIDKTPAKPTVSVRSAAQLHAAQAPIAQQSIQQPMPFAETAHMMPSASQYHAPAPFQHTSPVPTYVHPPEPLKKKKTITVVVRQAILEGRNNHEVLERVRREFPNAKTTAASISRYRTELRAEGYDVPVSVRSGRNMKKKKKNKNKAAMAKNPSQPYAAASGVRAYEPPMHGYEALPFARSYEPPMLPQMTAPQMMQTLASPPRAYNEQQPTPPRPTYTGKKAKRRYILRARKNNTPEFPTS
jgi:aspartate 1-decarboxylase